MFKGCWSVKDERSRARQLWKIQNLMGFASNTEALDISTGDKKPFDQKGKFQVSLLPWASRV